MPDIDVVRVVLTRFMFLTPSRCAIFRFVEEFTVGVVYAVLVSYAWTAIRSCDDWCDWRELCRDGSPRV